MDWSDIQVFLALYRGRSVRRAAEQLGMSHSTVSRHLSKLESDLETVLFTRSRDGLLATSVAEQLILRAEGVEREVMSFNREATGRDAHLTGVVRVATTPIVSQGLIMPHLADFARQYPDIELVVQSGYAIEDLARGAADIAVRFQKSPDGSLVGRRLPAFADYAYASPDYIGKHRFERGATTASWLGREQSPKHNRWLSSSPFPDAPIRHVLPDILDQAQAAAQGMGMAILPAFYGDKVPELQRIPGTDAVAMRSGWVLTHPDLRNLARIRVAIRFLVAAIS